MGDAALLGAGYKPDNIVLMQDDLAKLKNRRYLPEADKIRQELGLLLSGLEKGDSVLVAFSGHGVEFQGEKKNYFCPADTDLADRKTLVSLGEVYEKLKDCSAQRKLLLVDACRNDPQTSLSKGGRDKVKLQSVTRPQTEPIPKGIVALFSCSSEQESYEFPDLKHGIFFHHILEGWKGAADTGDGQLELEELVAYTRKETATFARLKLASVQTPQFKGEFDGSWVLRKFGGSKEHTSPSSGMKFALIPAGEFKMGSSAADVRAALQTEDKLQEHHFEHEQPQHPVRITKPFYMGIYEVTQLEFLKVLRRIPSNFSQTGSSRVHRQRVSDLDTSRFPVESVTWFDAIEFCNKLSEADRRTPYYRFTGVERDDDQSVKNATVTVNGGTGYRLPTEAEWEYACRGNTTTPFHFGSVLNGDKANVDGSQPFGTTKKGTYLQRTTAVDDAKYPKNDFGLAQMHGNVAEWCEDVYDKKAYAGRSQATSTNSPLVTSGSEYRVLRGGAWIGNPGLTGRSGSRAGGIPGDRDVFYGFRVACSSLP